MNNEENDNNDDDTTEEENPFVDRGWAWMVVAGALVINIIYDGCSYSFGIFFTKFLTHFGDTRSHTALIGSLFFSVPLLCGPIAGYITSRVGYRKSTMLGGLIAAVGFSCGAFSNSIAILCVTYGIIAGFGMSLPYFNSIVVEAVYFKKRRALATGIAESGAGVGTVIFAPLTNYLISVYGWRGALLIVGGIVANIIVCGALFRPIKKRTKHLKVEALSTGTDIRVTCTEETNEDCRESLMESNKDLNLCKCRSGDFLNTIHAIERTDRYSKVDQHCDAAEADNIEESSLKRLSMHSSRENLAKPRLFHSMLELHDNKSTHKHVSESNLRDRSSKINLCVRFISTYVANMSILTNRGFILFSTSNFVMYFWYDVPYVFLVDKAISKDISDINATFLISIIGIVHTVGNICYGVLGDREQVNKTILYGVSIIFCGATVVLMTLFTTYVSLAVLAGLFGLFSAANEAMCSIILIDVVGLKNLNQAYGVIMMLQGIANLVGPPVAGMLQLLYRCFTSTVNI